MNITENQIAKIEARLRALEAIIQCLPGVVTSEVLEVVLHQIKSRPYRHPDDVAGLSMAEEQDLAEDALNEIWRQMRDESPVFAAHS